MALIDDHSRSFHKVRGQLVGRDGRNYMDFLKGLKPDYRKVWRDLALGFVMIVLVMLAGAMAQAASGGSVLITLLIALAAGYWIAYVQLFIHEGAHFNLATDRARSDLLCDVFIGSLIGTSVRRYRIVHFQHHRAIGSPDDTEHTYFFPLNLVFLVKALFGLRAVEVYLSRGKFVSGVREARPASSRVADEASGVSDGDKKGSSRESFESRDIAVLLIGLVIHAAVVLGTFALAGPYVAASWVLSVAVFFPFFGALRQLLEHRDDEADPTIDYFRAPHGAITRMFGDGPVSSTFGGAGFNRHLLHHWEPTVSYTNLPQLERFLMTTPMGDVLLARRSSYAQAFLKLFSLR